MRDSERAPARAAGATITELRIARIPRAPDAPAPGSKAAARIDSRTLFRGGSREVVIAHDGTDYRLRVTASGKLILTK